MRSAQPDVSDVHDDEDEPTWAPLKQYPKPLRFYLEAIDGSRCLAACHYGRLFVRSIGAAEYEAVLFGPGGGFTGQYEWDRSRLFSYASGTIHPDTPIASGSVQELWPSGFLERRRR